MLRSAPVGGYDFGIKRQYRRTVWSAFGNLRRPGDEALLLPSIEGDEIEVALNAGFKQSELHVVDRNPAIVATLKRRFPYINTYGVSVQKIHDRLGHRLRFANLDLCGCISRALFLELRPFIRTLQAEAYVTVTMLRGRENDKFGRFCIGLVNSIPPTVDPQQRDSILNAYRSRFIQGVSPLNSDIGRVFGVMLCLVGSEGVNPISETDDLEFFKLAKRNWDLTSRVLEKTRRVGYAADSKKVLDLEKQLLEAVDNFHPRLYETRRILFERAGIYKSNRQTMLWASMKIGMPEWFKNPAENFVH